MSQNNYNQSRQEFEQFREKLYQSFNYRRDTIMDLVDAIAANRTARSPVELCLSPLFSREYSALYKGIQAYRSQSQSNSIEATKKEKAMLEVRLEAIADLIPKPDKFYLFAADVTPLPRPYAPTLEDRSIIYQPNTVQGNKPINIGHAYSVLTALPPKESTGEIPWAIPLMVNRVKSSETGKQVGSQQLKQILTQKNLPLWAARKLALSIPRSWERYLPQKTEGFLSPSMVNRDMQRIITEIGTPANLPKPRGYSSGRATGMVQTKRTLHQVIKKAKQPEPTNPIAV